ncbi:carboxypeptidase regulatory-like domain-containing protein [Planctomicrobium piriforme]|uniref:Carboxypeptidase regulatory-like domain-containing protein n=1 Tax=Planctomicrobium piriforme TaxID=1576369 RepID=A0A1I3CJQ8_9PLAN|nr:carboxypeptidase regulatory-like domain-containing protein [Planctomicrobium piriforme]SFH74830.1 hypothetical protein SAMN05421753_102314 [Planctomicrobium piriforme]
MTFNIRLAGLALVVLTWHGCGKATESNWLSTHPARGQVKINGVPACGAIVRLYPVNPQAEDRSPVVPTGHVKADGSFELTTYSTGDGSPAGDYRVTLEWPDPQVNASRGAMPEDPPDRLKSRFLKPERSTLKVLIAAGKNELEPIVLDKVEILAGSSLK